MKAYLINMYLLVPRSRSSAKVKVKYKGYISQKMGVLGAFMFHKHILFIHIQYIVYKSFQFRQIQTLLFGTELIDEDGQLPGYLCVNHNICKYEV